MTALVLQARAEQLPLPDDSVDLIITSPPYFALRSYTDGGAHYEGQLGSEPTPEEFLDALLEVTVECIRVLKPTGSLWVNLGDKYVTRSAGLAKRQHGPIGASRAGARATNPRRAQTFTVARGGHAEWQPGQWRDKSLMGLPWRYAIRAMDELGLILRQEQIWDKPNGIPEAVTDRTRRTHEHWFHFTLSPRYFSAMDEIREKHTGGGKPGRKDGAPGPWSERIVGAGQRHSSWSSNDPAQYNPLGRTPGSVWSVPTEPLALPPELEVDHFAAFPSEWPRRLVAGWSPTGICTACGEPLRPVVSTEQVQYREAGSTGRPKQQTLEQRHDGGRNGVGYPQTRAEVRILGYSCRCGLDVASRRPPTRPAVVLDPFGGTGTTAMVASALGRIGISVDLSHDYGRAAAWRTRDRNQLAKVLGKPRVDPTPVEQLGLFD